MKKWIGPVRPEDDFGSIIHDEFIDGRTKSGMWAIMTPENHKFYGVGLGIGLGQRYKRHEDGNWYKVEG